MANHLQETRVREEHLQGTFTGPPLPSCIQYFLHIHEINEVNVSAALGLAMLADGSMLMRETA